MCHRGATHSGTRKQARQSPVRDVETPNLGNFASSGGTGLLDAPLPRPVTESKPPSHNTGSDRRPSSAPDQSKREQRKEKHAQQRKSGGRSASDAESKSATKGSDTLAPASQTPITSRPSSTTSNQPPRNQAQPHKSPTHRQPRAYGSSTPTAKPPETKAPETKAPLRPLTREEAFGGMPERKIINLGSSARRPSNEPSTDQTQTSNQKETALVLKTVKFILSEARKDEERYAQQGRSYHSEIQGRLSRLHTVLFQSPPSKEMLHEGDWKALKRKILTGLMELTREKLLSLNLPRFLEENS